MAIVKPFKGVRPPKALVENVQSRPYDVLNSEEARAEAGDNEMSLYHIIKPEIDFEAGTADYCTMFDPVAYEYEAAGKGYVVASVGEASGEGPYTCFIAKDSWLDKKNDTA